MSERIHALALHLFGKATIEECDLSEVKGLAQRYPYFAPAQFLLLEKLKQERSDLYDAQLQKSILYYPDPLGFQYFINADRYYTEFSFDEPQAAVEDIKELPQFEEELPSIPEKVQPDHEADITATIETDHFAEPGAIQPTDLQSQEVTEMEAVSQETQNQVTEINNQQPVDHNEINIIDQETGTEVAIPEQTDTIPLPGLKETGLLKDQLNAPVKDTGISFEPFHTVDYFASQGIKISQEELPRDKFGKQVKSFTEWLKTMKRLPAVQLGTSVDASSENKVQNMAMNSIHDASVWTEAMAVEWIKQGDTQKAIEVYNKLSLLNPSKRAYFATKIENLKYS